MLPDTATTSRLSDQASEIIKIAVLAVGGQGGAVLGNWIVSLAQMGNYAVQMTSVAGVAQRTGATVYYIEMAPVSSSRPVFALNPSINDIDILIAAELMEAGRALQRGFISPDKTTVITSSHRILATSEKIVPGDGRADSQLVLQRLNDASLKLVCYDMEDIARRSGSVVSASLFGALAASESLPFPHSLYEQTIENSKRSVRSSMSAFRESITTAKIAQNRYSELVENSSKPNAKKVMARGPDPQLKRWNALVSRVTEFPTPAHLYLHAGLRATYDYQDADYATDYMNRVAEFSAIDDASMDYALTSHAAKYIARALCYDDLPHVADLKTRRNRTQRIRDEQLLDSQQIFHTTEYFHPRAEEVISLFPHKLGQWVSTRSALVKVIDWACNRGRRMRTDQAFGFTVLWLVAGLRKRRRNSFRHMHEMKRINAWAAQALDLCTQDKTIDKRDYRLALELIQCQRLIKGYSDTHARGTDRFNRISALVDVVRGHKKGAQWLSELRNAALLDEADGPLDDAITKIKRAIV